MHATPTVQPRAGMASTLAPTITPDRVMSFQIKPGTLPHLLETREEGGPRLKCFEGSVTFVSPGRPHETMGRRFDYLILAVCLELGIKFTGLGSTTWRLPARGWGHGLRGRQGVLHPELRDGEAEPAPRPGGRSRGLAPGDEGPPGRGVPQDPGTVGPRPGAAPADVLPPGRPGQVEGHLPARAPQPGAPRPDGGGGAGAARRPRGRRHRLPRGLPGLGEAGPRA